MSEWKKIRLGDIVHIQMGQSPDSKYYNSDSHGLPLIQGNADIKNRKSIQRIWTIIPTKVCEKGDILMTVRAPVGIVGISSFKSCLGRGVCGIKALSIDEKYLYHLLINHEESWTQFEQGSTFTAVGSKEIFNFQLLINNSRDYQKRIAKILTTCDCILEQTEITITKYKAIKQGMLHDLFTRGLDNNGKLRPTFQQAPGLYKESELGMIPKEWEVKRLENISAKIGDGIHTTPKYVDSSDYMFINGNNLVEGNVLLTNRTNYVSLDEYNKHKIDLNNKTILMSINGTIGNLAYYQNEKVILGKSAAYICCNSDVEVEFVYHFIGTDMLMKYFTDALTGSTIKNLSLASIRNAPILYPEPREQKQIVKLLSTFDSKLKKEEILLSKYQNIKQGLMGDLLGGKKGV